MIQSVSYSQDEILLSIKQLYCPNGYECDITYGNGGFWKNIEKPKLIFDLYPTNEKITKASSDNLPIEDNKLTNCVFDPPFITYIKNGKEHNGGSCIMSSRFGGYYSYKDLEEHYKSTINEVYRILKKSGILVFKCQDIIHNHKMHCTHTNIINWAESVGFSLEDLFILIAKHRMPGPQSGVQRHARIWHSYFLVFSKRQRNRVNLNSPDKLMANQ